MRTRTVPCAGLVVALFVAGSARADVLAVSASKDNTLYEDPSGQLSNALGPEMYVARTFANTLRRAVVAFDVAAIPPGSTVNSVTLHMACVIVAVGDSGNPRALGLHAAGADWGEGTSNALSSGGTGAPATPGDATWIHTFYDTQFWSAAGGDFAATASATTNLLGTGPYQWGSTAQLVADVQGWVDAPATNFGWIVIGDESTTGTGRALSTREGSSPPMLTVDFTPPPITTYCTGKTNSLGCVPFMTFSGAPSATSTQPFTLTMNDSIPNEAGFVVYGFKKANLDFHGGKLCVKAPLTRTGAKTPKNPGGGCTGWVLRRNFNGTIQAGLDPLLTAGQVVRTQWLNRDPADPAGFGDCLTDALGFTIAP